MVCWVDELPEVNAGLPEVRAESTGSMWCGKQTLGGGCKVDSCSVEQCRPWLGELCKLRGFAVPGYKLDCLFNKFVEHMFVTRITKGAYLKGRLVLKLGLFT